jgi:hypothetical protein
MPLDYTSNDALGLYRYLHLLHFLFYAHAWAAGRSVAPGAYIPSEVGALNQWSLCR